MKWIVKQSNGRIRRGYVRDWREFRSAAALFGERAAEMDTPPGLLTREWGHRAANLESEVFVPLSLASIGGLATSMVAACICWLGAVDAEVAGVATLGSGSAVFVVTLYNIARRQLDSLWTREEYGEDLPAPPPQLPEPRRVRVEVAQQDGAGKTRGLRWAELPISDTQYEHLRTYLLNHDRVNRDGLVGAGACALHGYAELKAALLAAGLIREIDAKGSAEVTPAGKAMARG